MTDTPIDMIIVCFNCGERHIDKPDPKKGWTNPPHKSHLCHKCGAIFRPADVCTNGVSDIKTKGKNDNIFMGTIQ